MSLSAAQRAQLHTTLLQQQAELREALSASQHAGATVELDQTRQGRLSRMDAMQAQAMAQAGARRNAAQLRLLDQALARVDEAEFGECRECGEDIALARLQLNPAVLYCIGCAEAREG